MANITSETYIEDKGAVITERYRSGGEDRVRVITRNRTTIFEQSFPVLQGEIIWTRPNFEGAFASSSQGFPQRNQLLRGHGI